MPQQQRPHLLLERRSLGRLSPGAFAGFLAAVLALLALLGLLFYFLRRRAPSKNPPPPVQAQLETPLPQHTLGVAGPRYSSTYSSTYSAPLAELAPMPQPSSWGVVDKDCFEPVELYAGAPEGGGVGGAGGIMNPSYEAERRRRYYERLKRGIPAEDAMSVNDDASWVDPVPGVERGLWGG